MGLLVFFLIWYSLIGRNNPRIYNSMKDKLGKIITAIVLISVFSSVIPSLWGLAVFFFAIMVVFSPFIFGGWLISSLFKGGKKKNSTQEKWNDFYKQSVKGSDPYKNSPYNKSAGRMGTSPNFTGLTRSVPKRKKIVQRFNKKYNLNLTDDEIELIVDASYVSFSWEREIYDMDQDMNSLFEWYNSETSWLRAYLRVLPVQSVSSDFKRQHELCIDIFDQMFTTLEPSSFATTADCIEAINNKYYTAFDDTTFMIAYNFLNRNGRIHSLPKGGVVHNESELDKLMKKYDESLKNEEAKKKRLV